MENPFLWQLLLQAVLILLNAVFACAEIAVISMNDMKLEQLAAQGDRRAIRLSRLVSQPARFLATIQVAITLSGFLGSAFAADNFAARLTEWLLSLGIPVPASTLNTVSVVIITLILSYVTLIFGELVPKRLAMKRAESLALGIANLVSLISKLFAPIVWALTASTNLVLRLCGVDPDAEDEEVSEEEIRLLVEKGGSKGVIAPQETTFIQNVFEFNDLTVEEFATHRTDVCHLCLDEPQEAWETTIHDSRHSRYPVCESTVDQVVGILDAKRYFRLSDKSRESVMQHAVTPPWFIPETVRADVLFKQMQHSRNHFAVVLDEYGGMAGIVTMSDLLEQLVGDLDDSAEHEPVLPEIEPLDSGTWRILGSAPLAHVAKALHVNLPVKEYDTFGGFVFACYGFVPEDGAEFELDACGLHIHVTQAAAGRRLPRNAASRPIEDQGAYAPLPLLPGGQLIHQRHGQRHHTVAVGLFFLSLLLSRLQQITAVHGPRPCPEPALKLHRRLLVRSQQPQGHQAAGGRAADGAPAHTGAELGRQATDVLMVQALLLRKGEKRRLTAVIVPLLDVAEGLRALCMIHLSPAPLLFAQKSNQYCTIRRPC